jgi:hypothetical protein
MLGKIEPRAANMTSAAIRSSILRKKDKQQKERVFQFPLCMSQGQEMVLLGVMFIKVKTPFRMVYKKVA